MFTSKPLLGIQEIEFLPPRLSPFNAIMASYRLQILIMTPGHCDISLNYSCVVFFFSPNNCKS